MIHSTSLAMSMKDLWNGNQAMQAHTPSRNLTNGSPVHKNTSVCSRHILLSDPFSRLLTNSTSLIL